METITVEITGQRNPNVWYDIGEQHEVLKNSSVFEPRYYISTQFKNRIIYLTDCKIINP